MSPNRTALAAVALLVSLAPEVLGANPPPRATTPPADARFEIIESPARYQGRTFRLNRHSGALHQLLDTIGERVWKHLAVGVRLPEADLPEAPRYVLHLSQFLSPLLLDSRTGRTWFLSHNEDGTGLEWRQLGSLRTYSPEE